MRADVVQPFALLGCIEEPARADVRRPSHDLHQVVDALHVDAGIRFRTTNDLAKGRRIVHEHALQNRRDLEALGHDVVRDNAFRIGVGQDSVELRQVLSGQDPRLVAEDVKAGMHGRRNAIELWAIASGKHDHVPRPFLQHAVQSVRARMNFRLPRRRARRALVECVDALQVFVEIVASRRVDIDAPGNAWIHLLLNEGGVKVAGVEGHQPHVRLCGLAFQRSPTSTNPCSCGQKYRESRFHGGIV